MLALIPMTARASEALEREPRAYIAQRALTRGMQGAHVYSRKKEQPCRPFELASCALRLNYCSAIWRWRRPIAALLGRFLPKLRAARKGGLFLS